MPSKSPAQHRLMEAAAHGWKKPGGGPSEAVGKEFVSADKKMAMGGQVPGHFSVAEEHDNHFVIHDARDASRFKVAKAGLGKLAISKVQGMPRFAEGGEVDEAPASDFLDRAGELEAASDAGASVPPARTPEDQAALTQFAALNLPPGSSARVGPGGAIQDVSQPDGPPPATAQAPVKAAMSAAGLEPELLSNMREDRQKSLDAQKTIEEATVKQQSALTAEAQAKAAYGDEAARIQQKNNVDMAQIQADHEHARATAWAEVMRAHDASAQKIDPGRWFESRSAGQKVAAVIASIAGGFNAGLTGGPNQALQFIEKQIDDDIGSQRANAQQANERFGQASQMAKMTDADFEQKKANMLGAVAGQLRVAAAKAIGPEAIATAEQASQGLLVKAAEASQRAADARSAHDLAGLQHIEAKRMGTAQRGALGDAKTEKEINDYGTAMDPMQSKRGPLADLAKRVMASERVDADIAQIRQRGATTNDLQKVVTEIQNLIGQGHVTEGEIHALMPKTLRGTLADKLQWITNHPTDAGAQEFIDRFAGTLETEKRVLANQVQRTQARLYSSKGKELERRFPDRIREIHNISDFDPSSAIDKAGKFVPVESRAGYKEKSAAAAPGIAQGNDGKPYRWNGTGWEPAP